MNLFYDFLMFLMFIAARVVSPFNKKVRLWVQGRKDGLEKLSRLIGEQSGIVWMHCASLGEFEQGRPLIEAIKLKYPTSKILLTFFSPSGYEIRKNYEYADYVMYLPHDYYFNAKRLIAMVKPVSVFFVKYEFWRNYLTLLHRNNIPTYLISANFRENQLFFKRYGKPYRDMLKCFTHIFVQTGSSAELLRKHDISNVTVAGDTRFDRVHAIAQTTSANEIVEGFCAASFVIVAGSTWPPDEDILVKYINEAHDNIKLIIAPHEIHAEHIHQLTQSLKVPYVLYTETNVHAVHSAKVLVINTIGILSSVYRYGDIAYIGGGFGKGIHNILEAATYGLPVMFGPNYQKFQEAVSLVKRRGAFVITTYEELSDTLNTLYHNEDALQMSSDTARDFVVDSLGATATILQHTKY